MASDSISLEESSSFISTSTIFFELASEQRLSILFRLSKHSSKLAQLAKDLDVTMQEVHRNLNRLQDSGLIRKDANGQFSLTTFGTTILQQIPTMNFLSRNKEYFSDHYLGDIPMKFVHRIGALDKSEYIEGLVAVLERWKQIYNSARDYIYGMLPQIPLELIETLLAILKQGGIKFNYILSQQTIVPKKRTDLLKDAGFQDLLKKGLVERRMVDKMPVAVILNEKEATVMFPTLKRGQPVADLNSIFYSGKDNLLFHEWCLDYFRYSWYGAKTFDESKLLEV
ncbi:MAG TPA: transcriptional regulator [Nitrososphaeraceae archaeon]|nr:transcriptional regulator [Nitrososphaeraceae archaeon]